MDSKLLDFEYYYNKLPLYLQESEGFKEHFRYWIELLQSINLTGNKIQSMLNIFDIDEDVPYLERNTGCSDFLNKLGMLYGVSRVMTINNDEVTLTDKLMLFVIKCQIIKNFFNGTYSQINKLYIDAKLPIVYYTLQSMEVEVIFCAAELTDYESEEIDILYELFDNQFLIVKSMGIQYITDKLDLNEILYFGSENDTDTKYQWDNRVWGV